MTAVLDVEPIVRRPETAWSHSRASTRRRTTHVEVLACGAPDRGDDGAAVIAVGRLADALPPDVRERASSVSSTSTTCWPCRRAPASSSPTPRSASTRAGSSRSPSAGSPDGRRASAPVRRTPCRSRRRSRSPRSSADIRCLGIVVAIGGIDFGMGEALSWPVASAMDAFVLAIADAVGRVRTLALAPSGN